jgi:hypothetical protein
MRSKIEILLFVNVLLALAGFSTIEFMPLVSRSLINSNSQLKVCNTTIRHYLSYENTIDWHISGFSSFGQLDLECIFEKIKVKYVRKFNIIFIEPKKSSYSITN